MKDLKIFNNNYQNKMEYIYNRDGYDKNGFNIKGIHKDTSTIYNKYGYDKNGFNKYGIHKDTMIEYDKYGYNRDGYDKDGYDRDGYDKNGFNKYGIHKDTMIEYDKYGYNRDGYDKYGYNRDGYDKNGFNIKGINIETNTKYDKKGFNIKGFNKYGIHKDTRIKYDKDGYDRNGYDKNGFNIKGINIETNTKYDKKGFNKYGINKDTWIKYDRGGYDKDGYDKNGYDEDGYDKDGYDKKGFYRNGINKETNTKYDKDGYNKDGYDKKGFYRNGINKETNTKYDKDGYDKDGYDKKGFYRNGINKETNTKYDKDGYDKDGYDKDGYDEVGSYIELYHKSFYIIKNDFNKNGININTIKKQDYSELRKFELKELGKKIEDNYLKILFYEYAYGYEKVRSFLKEKFNFDTSKLDDEKLPIILDYSQYKLVKARAGTGKTTLITYYISFLNKILNIKLDNILCFSFNKKSSKELQDRVQKKGDKSFLSSMTFHSFASRILFSALGYNNYELLYDKMNLKDKDLILSSYIKNIVINIILDDESVLEELYDFFKESSFSGILINSENIIKDLNYDVQDKTVDGKFMDSVLEKYIGDFLFEYGINFDYNIPIRRTKKSNYKKQFKVNFKLKNVQEKESFIKKEIIEKEDFYLFIGNNANRKDINECIKASNFSHNSIIIEEDYLKELSIHEIEDYLKKELSKYKVELKKLQKKELLSTIYNKNIKNSDDFIQLIIRFISKSKQNNFTSKYLLNKLNSNKFNKKINKFINFALLVYNKYEEKIKNDNKKDFYDLLREASEYIDELKGNIYFSIGEGYNKRDIKLNEIRYLFIDEYQDFSFLFHNLVQIIKKYNPNLKIVSVGDDWQLINSFMGSDMRYINNYSYYYKGSKEFYLQTTFRLPKEVVNFSNNLMNGFGKGAIAYGGNMQGEINNLDIINNTFNYEFDYKIHEKNIDIIKLIGILFGEKNLTGGKYGENYYRIKGKNKDNKNIITNNLEYIYYFQQIKNIIDKEEWINKKQSIFILFRKNNVNFGKKINDIKKDFIKWMIRLKIGKKEDIKKDKIKQKEESDFNRILEKLINFSTMHQSKGLESDIVIIFDVDKIPLLHPDNFLEEFFGMTIEDIINEEKRLLYVAITRTKNKLYLINSIENNKKGFFSNEDISYKDDCNIEQDISVENIPF